MVWNDDGRDDRAQARAEGPGAGETETDGSSRDSEAFEGGERSEAEGLADEVAELNRKWLRALADLDNYKKRVARERVRWADEAREALLLSLLDVIDDFERAVACGEGETPPSDDPFRQGVELILKRLLDILGKNDVRPIDTCGAEFDPTLHEAVGQAETGEYDSNQIVEELRRGYMLGDKLLRCSRVIVAK